MAVLNPLKVILTNYPEDKVEYMTAPLNPENPEAGERTIPFSRELYIEREDFMEDPPKKFFRLRPGGEVRLKYGYIIRCEQVIKDTAGEIVALHCTYSPDTKPGTGTWRSVKGTIHWLCARHAVAAEVHLFDTLFTEADMGTLPDGTDYKDFLNKDSFKVVHGLVDKDAIAAAGKGQPGIDATRLRMQFERLGYFVADYSFSFEKPVFNRVCTLRDSFAKTLKKD
jgi:glutaminyl-tRNA synthetase